MPGVSDHLDEVALLCLSGGELGGRERGAAASHVAECHACRRALEQIEELDSQLRAMAKAGQLERELSPAEFPPGDPFKLRPATTDRRSASIGLDAVRASDAGLAQSGRILDAVRAEARPVLALRKVRLEEPAQRFALYYALQESARRITESPHQALEFAEAVLGAPKPSVLSAASRQAEAMLPWLDVRGQANLLAAQANLWHKEYEAARAHLTAAYHDLARGGDETALAVVEMTESQRRSFLGEGLHALALARRARATFEERGLEDFKARAAVAEGLALSVLADFDAAISAYREALPVFERLELWSNYVAALNSLATALYRSGRLDEARREFARVLRRLSHERHRSVLGYLRHGLGDILFSAERFREAALSFDRAAQLYEESDLRASSLTATLAAAESWARSNSPELAGERLDRVARDLTGDRALEQSVRQAISGAIARTTAEVNGIASLRQQVKLILSKPRR